MRKTIAVAAVALAMVLSVVIFSARITHASGRVTPPLRSWGALRGGTSSWLYFEDANGTIRIYDAGEKTLQFEIQRQ
jgi:hypothetical protein